MSGPTNPERRSVLAIGPGGVPAGEVRAEGPDAPNQASNGLPPTWNNWMQSSPAADPPRTGRPKSWMFKVLAAVVVLAVVVGYALWSNAQDPATGFGPTQAAVGDCLAAQGDQVSGKVVCTDPDADFTVVGRYPGTSDASECSASPSDVAVIAMGPTVLCLDYVAAVGQCLLAGTRATGVGKVACNSTLPGVYRVTAVLRNSITARDCPAGTKDSLVHLHNSEVLCLGRP
jgi:hypothetical protein